MKRYIKIVGIVAIIFLLSGCSSQTQQTANQTKTDEATQPVAVPEEEIKIVAEKKPVKSELYDVVTVVDGDTIKVNINGTTETLRLIGIDTPETVDPRKPVQCFGKEASNKAKEILTGKKVRLEADSTQGERDKYNRLLRYIYLEDGTFFNKLMIEEGYAHEYTYQSNPYIYQTEFIEAENQARENNRGLWSPDKCSGNTTQSADTQQVGTGSTTDQQITENSSGSVKKSTTGICHAPGTTYYARTKNYTAFNTLQECLNSGGRLPKR